MAEAPDTFSDDWCNLEWTAWVPFSTTSRTLDSVPDSPGIYRIRPSGQNILMYIGWTDESLRQCFTGIRQNVNKPVMPWNDPWPVAAALWVWKDAKRYSYEFSTAPANEAFPEHRAVEYILAYYYRQAHHESPLCCFGRFHRKYRRPSNQKDGIAGRTIGPGESLNPAGGPGASPLPVREKPGDPGWMGLLWSPKRELRTHTTTVVPHLQGYYLIFDATSNEVLAIRRSENCAQDLFTISKNPWDGRELAYSFCCEQKPLPDHNLKERHCDLVGNYIEQFQAVPAYQFRNSG